MKSTTGNTKRSALTSVLFLISLSLMAAFVITGAWVFAVVSFATLLPFAIALSNSRSPQSRHMDTTVQPFIRDGAENLSIAQAREIMSRK